jgi:hypothetical protein
MMPKEVLTITIKRWVGNLVKYERYNDGLRYPLDQPYREKGASAKFRLPSGKGKTEIFAYDATNEQILEGMKRRYSNFDFVLSSEQEVQVSDTTKLPKEQNPDKKTINE